MFLNRVFNLIYSRSINKNVYRTNIFFFFTFSQCCGSWLIHSQIQLQCCGSKYIEFGSGSGILAQFGSGSKSGSRVMPSILKEKIILILEKNKFLYRSIFFKNKMTPEEIFSQLSHWIVNLYLKSYTICPYFILFLHVWIHKAPKNGFGSTTLLNRLDTSIV